MATAAQLLDILLTDSEWVSHKGHQLTQLLGHGTKLLLGLFCIASALLLLLVKLLFQRLDLLRMLVTQLLLLLATAT